MSSPKMKSKPTVNQQVKAGLKSVKDFLAGRSGEAKLDEPDDQTTREVVAAELLAAMSGQQVDAAPPDKGAKPSVIDTQEIPRFDADSATAETAAEKDLAEPPSGVETSESASEEGPKDQEQERARQLFLDHGYFDEAVQNLRGAKSAAERAAAARALGLFGSQRGTPHLIAAMFDDDPDVRSAAEEAMAQIGDPMVGGSPGAQPTTESEKAGESELPELAELELVAYAEVISVSSPIEAVESALDITPGGTSESPVAQSGPSVPNLAASEATDDENQLLLEEQAIRGTVEELGQQLLQTIAAIKESENEVQWRIEREGQLRVEAAERRRKEEEQRKRAAEKAEARRVQDREAVAAEQTARVNAESDVERFAEEQTSLRLKAARLRLAAEELARRRSEMETARLEADKAAREAEAARTRDEARARHEAALNRLHTDEQALHAATNEVAQQQTNVIAARENAESETKRLKEEQAAVEEAQRAEAARLRTEAEARNTALEEQLREQLEKLRRAGEELGSRRAEAEASRAKADAEAERLLEAQARMRVAEEARAQAETERARLEAEINQQVEAQLSLLEETRRRGEEEHARVQEEIRRQGELEEQRLAGAESLKAKAEAESKQRAEKEQQILSQIDSLRIADAETRRRIEDAEVRRRATEDAYRTVAEKVQRIEAEAHARAKEEERIIAKLEAARRAAASGAQSRAEQERRIREEIEMFQRLEEQERPRIEEATLQLAAAEARLQERKDRLKEEEEARAAVEEELKAVNRVRQAAPKQIEVAAEPEAINEGPIQASAEEKEEPAGSAAVTVAEVAGADKVLDADEAGVSGVTPAIATYLNSVDPYKRAAAVAELARSGGPEAFSQIVECFDDHSTHVRNAAARAFRKLEPKHTVDLFNRSLEGASEKRRRNIGAAIAASGLAAEAIENLVSENREDTYNALSILFVMAKTGEVQPLVQAIEGHESVQVRMAAIKLLTLTGQPDLANSAAKRRLAVNPSENDYLS